ncbi:MAG: MotA/TolQ/ExbB proton channel family protein [Planctomycetes bacterium]|nr:MotA/TolQ/ExbB proton channel family protein [Planctomycetota bacterium]
MVTRTRMSLWVFSVFLLLAGAGAARAAEAEAPTVSAEVNYFNFFVVKGGPVAYVIILLSVAAVALTIEHCVSIRRVHIVPAGVADRIRLLIDKRDYVEAVRYSAEQPSMLGYVLNAALLQAPNGFPAMERALEEAVEERSAKLYRKIEYLNIIGAVSPMLGLFGTVLGMILLFAAIHAADTFPRAQIVADRVSIALVATFWGLAVAIPSLSIYSVFRNRIEVLTAECALAADRILALFKPGGAASPATRVPNAAPTSPKAVHAT